MGAGVASRRSGPETGLEAHARGVPRRAAQARRLQENRRPLLHYSWGWNHRCWTSSSTCAHRSTTPGWVFLAAAAAAEVPNAERLTCMGLGSRSLMRYEAFLASTTAWGRSQR